MRKKGRVGKLGCPVLLSKPRKRNGVRKGSVNAFVRCGCPSPETF